MGELNKQFNKFNKNSAEAINENDNLNDELKSFGFSISTSNEDMIEQNANDSEIVLDSDKWEKINSIISEIEKNALLFLENKYGKARDEGHDQYNALVGTIFPKTIEQQKMIEDVIDTGEPLRTSSGTLNDYDFFKSNDEELETLASLIYIDIEFFE